jgi:hypothetical protein
VSPPALRLSEIRLDAHPQPLNVSCPVRVDSLNVASLSPIALHCPLLDLLSSSNHSTKMAARLRHLLLMMDDGLYVLNQWLTLCAESITQLESLLDLRFLGTSQKLC